MFEVFSFDYLELLLILVMLYGLLT